MMEYTLENYQDILLRQVIHMDQAVCYCPEFRATKMMHYYPSRRLQLARAIYKDEMKLSNYAGDINFASILSRQGERWQNFGESQEDCTDVTILARKMFLDKGYESSATNAFIKEIEEGKFNLDVVWDLPVDKDSKLAILVDNDTAMIDGVKDHFNKYCQDNHLSFADSGKATYLGFEFFAYGLIDQGVEYLNSLVDDLHKLNIDKLLVLAPKAAYLLREFVKKVGIKVNFKVEYLPEILKPIPQQERTYVYAGSFNLRYLRNADILNDLIPCTSELQVATSQEFIPLLLGNSRINKLTIWQKPIYAEYKLFNPDQKMLKAIIDDALYDIKKANADQVLVFEPTAYHFLKKYLPDCKVKYYLELL